MVLFTFYASGNDLRDEFGWLFSYMGLCEATFPACATCRRSMDAEHHHNRLLLEEVNATEVTGDDLDTCVEPCQQRENEASHRYRRDGKTGELRSRSTCAGGNVGNDKTKNAQQIESMPEDEDGSDTEYREATEISSVHDVQGVLLSAYREHVGPGVKVM